ncbi:uncharacterized protein LOC100277670 [Zea mays]|uniref:WRC domain-containing protein n=1 Tax=Zea mays TaxID=4577 RepID=B4FJ50_MAIZE|eukprot:NP_001144649.2 uncharacterized protein LOC100277670 [Zea mays]
MRIRKSASRLLGSAYSASAAPTVDAAPRLDLLPPPHPAPCSAPESCGGSAFSSPSVSTAEPCELSRSPWDLIADLSLSDKKVEDELVDKYFVHVTTRASWLFSSTVSATTSTKKKKKLPAAVYEDSTQLRREAAKKTATNREEGETKKKAKVKKEEVQQDGAAAAAAQVWKCKKNDGRRWHCNRPVSQPNTLCEYHFVQKRSYLNPGFEFHSTAELEGAAPAPAPVHAASSKLSTSNKPRKKKKPGNDFSATEGFYYYAGFGPFRTKRQCRSGGTNEPLPAKQEEEEETPEYASHHTEEEEKEAKVAGFTNQAASQDDVSSCDDDIAGIAGVDEESSDGDYDGIGLGGCNVDGAADPQASIGEVRRKAPWKRWRKPVKARSLKSLM